MNKVLSGILISVSLFTASYADSNQSTQNQFIYIDTLHKSISETLIEWHEIIDETMSSWLDDNETNSTDIETNRTDIDDNSTMLEVNRTVIDENITILDANITDVEHNTSTVDIHTTAPNTNRTVITRHTSAVKSNTTMIEEKQIAVDTNETSNRLEEKVHYVDQFFQNEKYLNETEDTYIRVRVESFLQSKESNDFGVSVSAQMPFSKSRKSLKIFVDDLTLDNADEILRDTSKKDDTPDIGIHYFASEQMILSRYSIGLSGLDPFVKARFNMPIHIDEWLIDPVQMFRYSTDDKFEEETNIYFDRKIGQKALFRIHLHRSTEEEINGMNYALSTQYFRSTNKDAGFGFAQSFYGNTEYEYTTEKGVPNPKRKKYGGIHDYVTSFTWREQIWRKWFYYEIRPSVSFHKQYDYEPNYRVSVFLDFYFGRIN